MITLHRVYIKSPTYGFAATVTRRLHQVGNAIAKATGGSVASKFTGDEKNCTLIVVEQCVSPYVPKQQSYLFFSLLTHACVRRLIIHLVVFMDRFIKLDERVARLVDKNVNHVFRS